MAGVHDKIKAELMVEIYANIDRIYDSIEQHFDLDDSRRSNVIKSLNTLKDELYFVVQTTSLS
ncbi:MULTISPECIES: hypothetical protein [unclassified Sulfuricurvum]|uniref:hypothetical protein n=1 Tax=unclassified Sulfuricurvum TaxID=2632390 RepID=UPI00029999E7|nr:MULTISPECIES: hypothetical protein [unclassified Sulfuricurvum]AFV97619.1 hypothetical protein B649_06525 [Candidatus Sulfuricurvum sp. RIFRC-1]OHD89433.1 MAG: hypothetical protein A3G19_00125 [Sulfuricurvum sp. RIFCSPLOWO2_12_FULL_43_24]HBM36887.1 hypothetical protein [Sulfuricurvum sp.]